MVEGTRVTCCQSFRIDGYFLMNKAVTQVRKDYGWQVAIVAKMEPKRHTTLQIHQVNHIKGDISLLSEIFPKYHLITNREQSREWFLKVSQAKVSGKDSQLAVAMTARDNSRGNSPQQLMSTWSSGVKSGLAYHCNNPGEQLSKQRSHLNFSHICLNNSIRGIHSFELNNQKQFTASCEVSICSHLRIPLK